MATYCGFQGAPAGASGVSGLSIKPRNTAPDAAKACCFAAQGCVLVPYTPLAPLLTKTLNASVRTLSAAQ